MNEARKRWRSSRLKEQVAVKELSPFSEEIDKTKCSQEEKLIFE